jgi:uncharacterized protein with PIN domain
MSPNFRHGLRVMSDTFPQNEILSLQIAEPLRFLLRKKWPHQGNLQYPLTRRASIKDILEAVGIPHTEIGSLFLDEEEIDFSHIPSPGSLIAVHEVPTPFIVLHPTVLRPQPLGRFSFLADINVGRLATLMRMAGFDTALYADLDDQGLAEITTRQNRILLTRDRQLLCRSAIVFARLLRHQDPYQQLREIFDLFALHAAARPFSRCMKCNQLLRETTKEAVFDQLEPLTKRYYNDFTRCPSCSSVYWQGSHRQSIRASLERVGLSRLLDGKRTYEQGNP